MTIYYMNKQKCYANSFMVTVSHKLAAEDY